MRVSRFAADRCGAVHSLEDALQQADEKAAKLESRLSKIAPATLITLAAGGIILNVRTDLLGQSRLTTLALIAIQVPAILNWIDYFWPGHGLAWFSRLFVGVAHAVACRSRCRSRRIVLETYGCESLSRTSLGEPTPTEALYFSVQGRVMRERKRLIAILCSLSVAIVLGLGLGFASWAESTSQTYDVGQSFQLDENWNISVTSPPRCGLSTEDGSTVCTVDLRVRNVSHRRSYLYAGSFKPLEPATPKVPDEYYAALRAGEDYYRPTPNFPPSGGDLFPGAEGPLSISFDAPSDVNFTSVQFSNGYSSDIEVVAFRS